MSTSISKNLPLDILIHILEYCNHGVKYRNGKFIDQIDKNDERLQLLYNLPLYNVPKIESPSTINSYIIYRNLGNYEVRLKKTFIDDLYTESRDDHELYYQLTFCKKRKPNDFSSIKLYNYIIK